MSTLKLNGVTSGSSIIKAPDSGSTGVTFTLPASAGTLAKTTDITSVGGATGVDFNDNVKARFGADNELEIYSDGTTSWIKETHASGDLHIQGKEIALKMSNGENSAIFREDGAVELMHNAVEKFKTTATGVDVTGYLNAQEVNTHWHFVAASQDINTAAVIDFATQITKGSSITESAGRFTCSIAGTYLLMVMFNNASDFDDTTNVWMRKNTTRIGGSLYYEGPTAGQDYSSQGAHCIVQLAANDVVDVYGSGRWSGNTNNEAGTYFQGIRIGE